jgi:hypothetical protein
LIIFEASKAGIHKELPRDFLGYGGRPAFLFGVQLVRKYIDVSAGKNISGRVRRFVGSPLKVMKQSRPQQEFVKLIVLSTCATMGI